SATLPTAMAYVSDSTNEEERGGKMGMIGAAMGIGMVIGPGLGGWLANSSLSAPFFLASGLSFFALIIVFLVLPEVPRRAPKKDIRIRGPQIQNLWKALKGPIGILLWMAFLLSFGLTNFESVFGLYAKERYNYTPQQVGTILTVIGLISALIQGGLTGPATCKFGEIKVIRAAFISSAIGFLLMTLAQNYLQVMVTAGYFVLSNAMLNPSVASLISKNTSTEQGITMGLNNSFLSLGRIIGPMWAGSIFDMNIHFPYFSGSMIMLVGFFMSLIWSRREVNLSFNSEVEN
ncbi:MAG: MFS transporter, partial [Anaerolineales bacterium]